MTEPDALVSGTVLANTYRVCGHLGSGGMGQIYEATHLRLPQRVAIKVIRESFSDEAIVRFRREAEIASSLRHPHIVDILDYDTLADGCPYMVMELLEGHDLRVEMREGPMPVQRVLRIASQVGSALTAAHGGGIVHRDLKPANIFLTSHRKGGETLDHAVVLDFGISKRPGIDATLTETDAIIGTPRYMAPEQAMANQDEIGPKADQFALGTLLYEMLSGRAAFGRDGLAKTVYRVCHTDPLPLGALVPGLGAHVVAAIARAMAKEPKSRFPTVAAFVASLCSQPAAENEEDRTLPQSPKAHAKRKLATNEKAGEEQTVANSPNARERQKLGVATTEKLTARESDDANEDQASKLEVPPSNTRGPTPTGWFLAFVVLAISAAVVGAVLLLGSQRQSATSSQASLADGRRVQEIASSRPHDAPVAPAPAPTAELTADAAAPPSDSTAPVDAGTAVHNAPTTSTQRSADRAKLGEAKRLLSEGHYKQARVIITRNPELLRSTEGRALIVQSYCGEHKFGTAQDWLARVARRDQKRVQRYCQEWHDVTLTLP